MNFDALHHVPVPIIVLERTEHGTFSYSWMNQAAMGFSGLRPADVIGKTPREVFPGRAGDRLAEHQEAAAKEGRASNYSYPLSLPNGEVWIETTLVPVHDADGTVSSLIATMQDRTAEHELQEQNLKSQAQIQNVASEIESYISMAAHDLRTPMGHVSQIAELLREDFVDHGDGKIDLIDMLEEIGVKASELIQEVLSVARASDGPASFSAVNLAQLASDIFAVLDPKHQFCLSSDAAMVETDRVALQIALRNLTDNAIKHCNADRITVHLGFLGECDGMLSFEVRDNGRGFNDPSIAFLGGGEFKADSGFGMLGVKRIVSARGGNIAAIPPEDGSGALIRFSLPGRVLSEETAQTFAAQWAAQTA